MRVPIDFSFVPSIVMSVGVGELMKSCKSLVRVLLAQLSTYISNESVRSSSVDWPGFYLSRL